MGFFRGAAVAPEPVPTENRGGIASTSSSDTRPTALSVGRRDTAGSEELDDEEEGEFNGAESTEGLFEGPRSPGGTKDSAEGGGARSPGPGGGGGSIVRSPRGSAGNSKRRSVPDRLSRKSSGWNDMFGSKQAELDEELDLESSADLPGLASYKSKFQRSKSRMVVSNPDEVTGVKVRTVNARFEPFLSRDSEVRC